MSNLPIHLNGICLVVFRALFDLLPRIKLDKYHLRFTRTVWKETIIYIRSGWDVTLAVLVRVGYLYVFPFRRWGL